MIVAGAGGLTTVRQKLPADGSRRCLRGSAGALALAEAAAGWPCHGAVAGGAGVPVAHAGAGRLAPAWYTSRPEFCNSCHIMEPYYKSWQESSHKNVSCIECHFPPGIGGEGPRQDAGAGAIGQVRHQERGAASRPPRSPTPVACGPAATRRGCWPAGCDFHGIPFDHTPHLQADPPRQAVPLHQLPQPDRAGAAHDGDHVDLLPLPLQGPAVQRGPGRLHPLPPDPRPRSSTSAAA